MYVSIRWPLLMDHPVWPPWVKILSLLRMEILEFAPFVSAMLIPTAMTVSMWLTTRDLGAEAANYSFRYIGQEQRGGAKGCPTREE